MRNLVWRMLMRAVRLPFEAGQAPLDARACCQEAAFRLFGQCGEGCCTDSQVHSLMEDWSDDARRRALAHQPIGSGRH